MVAYGILSPQNLYALPEGAVAKAGQIEIETQGKTMVVRSGGRRGIVEYSRFNIQQDETVRFDLPSRGAAILNRVTGGETSHIMGRIQSNGQVFLVNPSGIVFGSTSQVQVGGLVASTLQIHDEDFMAGRYVFQKPDGAQGQITNQGRLASDPGGYITLISQHVENQGVISAPGGSVHIAVGDKIQMAVDENLSVEVSVDEGLKKTFSNLTESSSESDARILNTGIIQSNQGGRVHLQAKISDMAYSRAINNQGVIQATGVREDGQGNIILVGEGTDGIEASVYNKGVLDARGNEETFHGGRIAMVGDTTLNSGFILANSVESFGIGGDIRILGRSVGLLGAGYLDASGAEGGGTIEIGGARQGQGDLRQSEYTLVDPWTELHADAQRFGHGGDVVIWSKGATNFSGYISAQGGSLGGDGGFAEVSGKEQLSFQGEVNLTAPHGEKGTLLLDPDHLVITDVMPSGGNPVFWTDSLAIDTADAAQVRVAGPNQFVTEWQNILGNDGAVASLMADEPQLVYDGLGLPELIFDGSSRIRTPGFYDLGTQSTTLIRVRIDTLDTVLMGGDFGHYSPYIDNGNIYFRADAGFTFATVPHGIGAGSWVNLAVVRNGNNVEFFVNGVSIGTDTTTSNQSLLLNTLGGYNNNAAWQLDGRMQEVMWFNHAMGAAEVSQLTAFMSNKHTQNVTSYIDRSQITYLSQTANVALQANQNITIQDMGGDNTLALTGAGKSITLTAGGSITMLGGNDVIRTEGGNIQMSAGGNIQLSTLDTRGAGGAQSGGGIQLSTTSGNISFKSLQTLNGDITLGAPGTITSTTNEGVQGRNLTLNGGSGNIQLNTQVHSLQGSSTGQWTLTELDGLVLHQVTARSIDWTLGGTITDGNGSDTNLRLQESSHIEISGNGTLGTPADTIELVLLGSSTPQLRVQIAGQTQGISGNLSAKNLSGANLSRKFLEVDTQGTPGRVLWNGQNADSSPVTILTNGVHFSPASDEPIISIPEAQAIERGIYLLDFRQNPWNSEYPSSVTGNIPIFPSLQAHENYIFPPAPGVESGLLNQNRNPLER